MRRAAPALSCLAALLVAACGGSAPHATSTATPVPALLAANPGSGELTEIGLGGAAAHATVSVPGLPGQTIANQAGTMAWTLNTTDATISVVDLASHKVVTTKTVGKLPVDMALSPDGTTLYVVDNLAAKILVLNATTLAQQGAIATSAGPATLSLSPDGTVGLLGSAIAPGAPGQMTEINLTKRSAGFTFQIGSGEGLQAVIAANDTSAWVLVGGQQAAGQLLPLDLANDKAGTPITLGAGADDMAISGGRAVVTNSLDGTVDVVDLVSRAVLHHISIGGTPNAAALATATGTVWVSDAVGQRLVPVNPVTGTIGTAVMLSEEPAGVDLINGGAQAWVLYQTTAGSVLKLASDGRVLAAAPVGIGPVLALNQARTSAWVVNSLSDTVQSYDIASGRVGPPVKVPHAPSGAAVTPDGSILVVASEGDAVHPGTVSLVSAASNSVVASLPVGVAPDDVEISPDGTTAMVSNFSSNSVTIIDLRSRHVTATLAVGKGPASAGITADSRYAIVAGSQDGTVTVITLGPKPTAGTPTKAADTPTLIMDPTQDRVYLFSAPDAQLASIALPGLNSGSSVALTGNSFAGTISSDGKVLVLVDDSDDTAEVLPLPLGGSPTSVKLDGRPDSVTITPGGHSQAWVLEGSRGEVVPLNLTHDTAAHPLTVPDTVSQIAAIAP